MLLENRVVVVSGIGPGMGRDIALACAREGADIALAARSADRLAAVAEEVEALGRRALAVPTDATAEADVARLMDRAESEFGGIDVLVNNAFSQPPFATLEAMALDDWYASMEVNCTAALKMSRAALAPMRRRGGGSIVNIATMSIRNNRPHFGAYAAAKSALTSITRTMAQEVGPDRIRVNAVCPGDIDTAMGDIAIELAAAQEGITVADMGGEAPAAVALRRRGLGEDVGKVVAWLAGSGSGYVTGVSIPVDGAWAEGL